VTNRGSLVEIAYLLNECLLLIDFACKIFLQQHKPAPVCIFPTDRTRTTRVQKNLIYYTTEDTENFPADPIQELEQCPRWIIGMFWQRKPHRRPSDFMTRGWWRRDW